MSIPKYILNSVAAPLDFFKKNRNPLVGWLGRPLSYILLLAGILCYAWLVAHFGILVGIGIIFLAIAGPLLLFTMFNHIFGLSIMLVAGFFVHFLSKYTNAPIGISMDGLMALMLFGLLVMQTRRPEWSVFKNTISIWVLIWVGYNLLQGINPWALSKMAWLFTVRTMALLIFVYFIACYAFDSLAKILWMLKLILGLLLFAALYGIKQELIGFSAVEEAWIYADQLRFELLFQWTRMRIFSLLNDPTTFGIMMAYGGVFCLVLVTGPFALWKKVIAGLSAGLMFLAMTYTGTRTAFALVPVGIFLFALLTLNKKILLVTFVGLIAVGGLLMKSTSNPLIFRIQSAFRVTEDESMQVRFENQKLIQPFIWNHPVGAGLGSTGVWGKRFTPGSWLADFPHDSGFVRIAVEMGWIGLILYLGLLFAVMWRALYYYVHVRDPGIKVIYLGIFITIFMLSLASYPQEIIVHLPSSLIFYLLLAAIVRLKDFDRQPLSPN